MLRSYRVGAFGFAANSNAGLTGNYGFYDQVATLKWVQQHAAAFGGDPDRVRSSLRPSGHPCSAHVLTQALAHDGVPR